MNNHDDHNLQPNASFRVALTLAAVLTLLSGTAYGQVPSTNDTSDYSSGNTGMGAGALGGPFPTVLTGINNTAAGYQTLGFNSSGSYNTASGYWTLINNTTGSENTAFGAYALYSNTTGNYNTASGNGAIYYNTTGDENTASGFETLNSNTTGFSNTAFGASALRSNTTGYYNTSSGTDALHSNTTGQSNTANGVDALYLNTAGENNTASGMDTLYFTTGSNNIAVGYEAGFNVTTGSNNIDIGNKGLAADNGATRIGTAGSQKEVFIAGIESSKITGSAVYVNSNGRLGVLASSERYKTAIEPMGANTEKLGQLRPVIFKLKTDAKGTVQYGLIAEEVAKVYPELVIRDEKGRIDGVRYDELAPMLLNEMQKEQSTVATLVAQHKTDAAKLDSQAAKIASLEQQLAGIQATLIKLQPKDQLVAQR